MLSRLRTAALLGIALAMFPGAALAARKAVAPATKPIRTGLETLEKQVQTFTLPNGLRFIVVERHEAPVFSFFTAVGSGSANDEVGTTGIAHMMEHMAFKGTTEVGSRNWGKEHEAMGAEEQAYDAYMGEKRKGSRADTTRLAALEKDWRAAVEKAQSYVDPNAYTRWIEQAGGQGVNAFTADDITGYFYSLPSNRLELWADARGGAGRPVFREFYKERDVVYEERRMRYESSPSGRMLIEFLMAAFPAHPYGFGGIGYPSDLKSFSRSEGEAFFRKHYVAKNMTIALVGDVTLADVRALADKYFAAISDAPAPPPLDTQELVQEGERRVTIEDTAQPIVAMGWKAPPATDPAYPACKAMANLLGRRLLLAALQGARQGEESRDAGVQQHRVPWREVHQPVRRVRHSAPRDRIRWRSSPRSTRCSRQPGVTPPSTQEELDGYKVRVRAQKIGSVEDDGDLASGLAEAQSLYGDWREFFRAQERVQALTPQQLGDALRTYVTRKNRTVAEIVPPATAQAEGGR